MNQIAGSANGVGLMIDFIPEISMYLIFKIVQNIRKIHDFRLSTDTYYVNV